MPLHITVQREADMVIVALTGELDLDTAPGLHEQLAELLADGCRRFVFDLTEMPFCDSTGLSEFIQIKKACDELGGDVRLARPPRAVRRVLELSGVTDALPIFASLDEALAA